MEFDPQDQKVVELLTKLKGASESYPSHMLAARRQAFLNTMAGAGLSVGTGSALNGTLKGGGGSGAASLSIGKVLEVALIVAIVMAIEPRSRRAPSRRILHAEGGLLPSFDHVIIGVQ